MTDENVWKKLDCHGQQIADITQRFAVVDSRVSAIESRFDLLMQTQAEGRAEVRQYSGIAPSLSFVVWRSSGSSQRAQGRRILAARMGRL